jgi:hypothetical protein
VVRISLKDQWSPRIGVIWDPTQAGGPKVYANYGRYYEQIPLDIADRELTPEPCSSPCTTSTATRCHGSRELHAAHRRPVRSARASSGA